MFGREASVSSGGVRLTSPPQDIHFQVRFDTDPEPNLAVIDVFNLSSDTTNRFRRGETVILGAGYRGDVGTIVAGVIDEVRSAWNVARGSGNERVLRLEATDASERWMTTRVSRAYRPGIRASQILSDLLGTYGLEIGALQLPEDVSYINGRTLHTTLRAALRQVVEDCGAKLHTSGGAVFILPPEQGLGVAIVLSPDTGLVESPERIDSDEGEFWRVVSLLNHRIRADSIVKVESRGLSGYFRVVKGEHICGDQDYETRMEVAAL